jgi:hypothetical protein
MAGIQCSSRQNTQSKTFQTEPNHIDIEHSNHRKQQPPNTGNGLKAVAN